MLFRKIFLPVLIPFFLFCAEKHFFFPCFNDTLAVYLSSPDTNYSAIVYFVPSPGYMDHRGNLGVDKEKIMPNGGVYDVWRIFLNSLGLATVSFDKPGTGASSGRLSKQAEAAFVCVFSEINRISGMELKPYFIFTYSSGFDYFRYALSSIKNEAKGKKPSGVVFLAGLPSWYTSIEEEIPILSVMGDTSLSTRNIKKARLMFQANWDTLSQVVVFPRADVHLCDSAFRAEENRCRYNSGLMERVGEWIGTAAALGK